MALRARRTARAPPARARPAAAVHSHVATVGEPRSERNPAPPMGPDSSRSVSSSDGGSPLSTDSRNRSFSLSPGLHGFVRWH